VRGFFVEPLLCKLGELDPTKLFVRMRPPAVNSAVLKGAESECKALKEEFKSRGLLTANVSRSLGRIRSVAVSTSPP
jgi:hypothetical protein